MKNKIEKNRTSLKKLYNNFYLAFIVVSMILLAHILKVIFTAGFLYFYFGSLTDFTNYNGV